MYQAVHFSGKSNLLNSTFKSGVPAGFLKIGTNKNRRLRTKLSSNQLLLRAKVRLYRLGLIRLSRLALKGFELDTHCYFRNIRWDYPSCQVDLVLKPNKKRTRTRLSLHEKLLTHKLLSKITVACAAALTAASLGTAAASAQQAQTLMFGDSMFANPTFDQIGSGIANMSSAMRSDVFVPQLLMPRSPWWATQHSRLLTAPCARYE